MFFSAIVFYSSVISPETGEKILYGKHPPGKSVTNLEYSEIILSGNYMCMESASSKANGILPNFVEEFNKCNTQWKPQHLRNSRSSDFSTNLVLMRSDHSTLRQHLNLDIHIIGRYHFCMNLTVPYDVSTKRLWVFPTKIRSQHLNRSFGVAIVALQIKNNDWRKIRYRRVIGKTTWLLKNDSHL